MSAQYHEPPSELKAEDRDIVRALASLKEEIEAVDWYHQRLSTAEDPELKALLTHNRDEEVEHACMTIEWLRRVMPVWDEMLKEFLFIEGSIAGHEEGDEGEGGESGKPSDLGIGNLKS